MGGADEGSSLSVEAEVVGPDGRPTRLRLSRHYPAGPVPTSAELAGALKELQERLAPLLAPPPHTERELDELVQTYRPRQVELVELLRADGELSEREADLLRRHLAAPSADRTAAPGPSLSAPPAPRAPTAGEAVRGSAATPRPVPELLATYQITSLRQAGAVRARRQISFEEYMALKRHFSEAGTGEGRPG